MFENKFFFKRKKRKEKPKKNDDIIYIKTEDIEKNPYQPRKFFDIGALNELSKSIEAYGIIQPLNVRRKNSGKYELVTGERRLRAAILADIQEIPCIVVNVTDNDSALIALVENLQRDDLNCIEEAEAYERILTEYNMTQKELGFQIGKSQSAIANKTRLLKLSPMVKRIIINNNLSERHARCLLQLKSEEEKLKILKKIRKDDLNVRDTENLVKDTIKENTGKTKTSKKNKKSVVRDIRIFINTIKQAFDLMVESGIKAESEEYDKDGYFEFVIKIPKY